jgi:hypothetical protein
MQRPAAIIDPAKGLFRADHFQMAYATNDIDQACALFRDRFGISEFARLEGKLAAGGRIRVELAWVGSIMYELMWAEGPGSAIYMDRLPDVRGLQLRHHHLGYLIDDEAQWQALVAGAGERVVYLNENRDFMSVCFVDAPELGHYLEYIWPSDAGRAFFESVPRQ